MVWCRGLLVKIVKVGISGNIFNFIENFISKRTFQVNVNGFLSNVSNLDNGIPQVSVIAPTLFGLFINYLIDFLRIHDENKPKRENKIYIALFADDTAFWRADRSLKRLNALQEDINNLQKWAEKWGVRISKAKTVCILFKNVIKRSGEVLCFWIRK